MTRPLRTVGPDEPTGPPWERQPGETSRAFAAFTAYRDMGPRRSLRRLADRDEHAPKVRQLAEWSARWNWPARSAAWDDRVDHEAQVEAIEAAKHVRRLELAVARTGLTKALAALRDLDPARLKPYEIAALASAAARVERVGRQDADPLRSPVWDGDERTGGVAGSTIINLFARNPKIAELADELADLVDVDGYSDPVDEMEG